MSYQIIDSAIKSVEADVKKHQLVVGVGFTFGPRGVLMAVKRSGVADARHEKQLLVVVDATLTRLAERMGAQPISCATKPVRKDIDVFVCVAGDLPEKERRVIAEQIAKHAVDAFNQ